MFRVFKQDTAAGEWSDEQVEKAAQNIKRTDSRDTNVILEIVEEFLPEPIRDAL